LWVIIYSLLFVVIIISSNSIRISIIIFILIIIIFILIFRHWATPMPPKPPPVRAPYTGAAAAASAADDAPPPSVRLSSAGGAGTGKDRAAVAGAAVALAVATAAAAGQPAAELLHYHSEQWVVVWETEALLRLGRALSSYISAEAFGKLQSEIVKRTAFSAVMAAMATPSLLLKAYSLIDNPWAVAEDRAEQVGELLAKVLLTRVHGRRPVSLSAFSLGCRALVACCVALDRAGPSALGILEDVTLIGAPVSLHSPEWAAVRRVTAGRVVNCYCAWDWILPSVYRAGSPAGLLDGIAGLEPVRERGVQNVDVSDLVSGHLGYREALPLICARVRDTTRPLYADWTDRCTGAAETLAAWVAAVPRGIGQGAFLLGNVIAMAVEASAAATSAGVVGLGTAVGIVAPVKPALASSDSAVMERRETGLLPLVQ